MVKIRTKCKTAKQGGRLHPIGETTNGFYAPCYKKSDLGPKHGIKKGYSERKKKLLLKHPLKVVQLIERGEKEECKCCGKTENLTFDHIMPTSKGGSNALENGQILCKFCNNIKDDMIISIKTLRSFVELNIGKLINVQGKNILR